MLGVSEPTGLCLGAGEEAVGVGQRSKRWVLTDRHVPQFLSLQVDNAFPHSVLEESVSCFALSRCAQPAALSAHFSSSATHPPGQLVGADLGVFCLSERFSAVLMSFPLVDLKSATLKQLTQLCTIF